MPFYDYKCNQCAKKFEAMHGMGAKPDNLTCEFCQSKDVVRVFYPVCSMGGGKDEFVPANSHSGGGCSSCSSGACGSCGH